MNNTETLQKQTILFIYDIARDITFSRRKQHVNSDSFQWNFGTVFLKKVNFHLTVLTLDMLRLP